MKPPCAGCFSTADGIPWSHPGTGRQRATGSQYRIILGCAQLPEMPFGCLVHSVSFHLLNLFFHLAEGFT